MLGILHLTSVCILFLGGLIALIIQNTSQLKRYGPTPILAFLEGIVIAFILDDLLVQSNLTYDDIIATLSFIVFFIISMIPIVRDWFKSRNKRLEKIENHLHRLDVKIANIDGK